MKLIIFLILLTLNIFAYGKQIIVGVLPFAPPYTSSVGQSNQYYGFCIDLMNEICARIHEQCHYKATEFAQQLSDLRKGVIDLTFLASPIIPDSNDSDYINSLPYLPSKGRFLALESTPINSLNDLKMKKLGVLGASYLKRNFLSRYISQENIREYPNLSQLITGLTTHEIDALLVNSSVAEYLDINIKNVRLIGDPIDFGMGYGISALKKNADLINKINKTLLEIQEDGTYIKIYSKYFGD